MLPKANRLTRKKDFDQVFKNGSSVKAGFLVCKVAKNQLPESRFGFIVSKKISNKATVRNKIKRRLRQAVLSWPDPVVFKKGLDVVMVSLLGIQKKEFFEIRDSVFIILKKL